jgi:hypothetical protein
MKRGHLGISLLASIVMTAQASAATVCDQGSSAALKTAAVQQELMVAGLTCNASDAYNRFVLADQLQLQKSDADLMAYFRARDGNEAGYDSYKTKLANLAANKSSAPGNSFCAATARVFQASDGVPLTDFVASQHLLIAAPEGCAVKYDLLEDATVAGPSYALPAAPFGAPAPPVTARRQADPDELQAHIPPQPLPQRVRQQQQEYPNGGWIYGPYGWVPPRPPRPWGYGGYYD